MRDDTLALDLPLNEIAELCRRYDLPEFSVFGSGLLRDDFDADRDIDFLVLFRPDAKIGFLEVAALQRQLAGVLGRPVDLVPERGLKPIIQAAVLASARVVYASV